MSGKMWMLLFSYWAVAFVAMAETRALSDVQIGTVQACLLAALVIGFQADGR